MATTTEQDGSFLVAQGIRLQQGEVRRPSCCVEAMLRLYILHACGYHELSNYNAPNAMRHSAIDVC